MIREMLSNRGGKRTSAASIREVAKLQERDALQRASLLRFVGPRHL